MHARAREVCEKRGIHYGEPEYYVDIVVWLPDVRWGVMPPCVTCGSADHVQKWSWQDSRHPSACGRRFVSQRRHRFVMTRRYICRCCARKRKADAAKAYDAADAANAADEADAAGAARAAADTAGAERTPEVEKKELEQYTFMGYVAASGRACLPPPSPPPPCAASSSTDAAAALPTCAPSRRSATLVVRSPPPRFNRMMPSPPLTAPPPAPLRAREV